MKKTINYHQHTLSYTIEGKGKCVVLLHGYLETLEIWGDFAQQLATHYTVICPDLPGHGRSALLQPVNTMESMAEAVVAILDAENIAQCTALGHSMGGYVVMALAEHYAHRLEAFSLFHSSPFADAPEKRSNRNREIAIVQSGHKAQLYNSHFPNTFAADTVEQFAPQIEAAIQHAQNMSNEAIVATLEGMKQRTDRTAVLAQSELPFLYVIGLKDNFIPTAILDKISFPQRTTILRLTQSGHNGFVEEPEAALKGVSDFLATVGRLA